MEKYEDVFERYAEHSPTCFDQNINIDTDDDGDRSSWFKMPVSQTRDSECLDQSNFACFLEALGGEGEDVEVHRFGHWGPGWYEIILVRPTAEAILDIAYDLARGLQDYPVLDEEDLSRRESEATTESWESWGYKDFQRECEDTLEGRRDDEGDTLLHDPNQRWCQDTGMATDICYCGNCFKTENMALDEALQKLDDLSTDELWILAHSLGMETEYRSDGPSFKYSIDFDDLMGELI